MAPIRVRVIEYILPAVTDGKDELYRLVTAILDLAQASIPRKHQRRT